MIRSLCWCSRVNYGCDLICWRDHHRGCATSQQVGDLPPISASTPKSLQSRCRAQVRAATSLKTYWPSHRVIIWTDTWIPHVDICTSLNAKSRILHDVTTQLIKPPIRKGVGHTLNYEPERWAHGPHAETLGKETTWKTKLIWRFLP